MTTPGHYDTHTDDMYAVHGALLGAFDDAPRLVASAGTDLARHEVVTDFYHLVFDFLHAHHAGEDELLYPRLEDRCPHERAMLERIDAQHVGLHGPMARAQSALANWEHGDASTSSELLAAMAAVDEPLRVHLTEEETVVLPVARQWISPDEWDELRQHGMGSVPPDRVWLVMGLINEHLSDSARAHMFGAMPPEVRALAEEQWLPMFDSYITALRG